MFLTTMTIGLQYLSCMIIGYYITQFYPIQKIITSFSNQLPIIKVNYNIQSQNIKCLNTSTQIESKIKLVNVSYEKSPFFDRFPVFEKIYKYLIPFKLQNNLLNMYFNNIQIELPQLINSKILNVLIYGYPSDDFDCLCYAHYLNDVKYTPKYYNSQLWIQTKFDKNQLKPGHTIIMYDDNQNISHFAVYLDQGLYISKFGTTGGVYVSDLSSMKKYYNSNDVYQIIPRYLTA